MKPTRGRHDRHHGKYPVDFRKREDVQPVTDALDFAIQACEAFLSFANRPE